MSNAGPGFVGTNPPIQSPDFTALEAQARDHVAAVQQSSQDTYNSFQQQATNYVQKISLVPQEQVNPDPIEAAYQAEVASQQASGRQLSESERFSIRDAVRRAAGQAPTIQPFEQLQQQVNESGAKDNTFMQNVGQAAAQGYSAIDRGLIGTVAPQYAARLNEDIKNTYATPEQGSWGNMAGKGLGLAVTAAGIAGAGAAAPTLMAAQGFGDSRTEATEARNAGQKVSGAAEIGNAVANAAVQFFLGNTVQKLAGSSAVPFSKIISQLPPSISENIIGTNGKVLVPYIAQTLIKMGVGAGDADVAGVASNIAAYVSGVRDHGGFVKTATEGLGENAVSGALIAGGMHGAETIKHPDAHIGAVERGEPVQEAPPEIKPQEVPQQVQPQQAQVQPQPAAPKSVSDASDFFDQEDEGRQLPIEDRANDTEQLTQQLQQQASESDAILKRVNDLPSSEPAKGQLPDNTNLATGEVDHPLVAKAGAKVATDVSPEHRELIDDVSQATGKKIIPVKTAKFSGYSDPEHPDAVLVDVRNPKKDIWNVTAHEVGHTLQYDHPEVFNALRDRLPQWFKKQAETLYRGMLKKAGYDEAAVNNYWGKYGNEEIVSMAFGESAASSKMLQRQLRGKEDGVWNGIRSSVEKVLNKFSGRGKIINEISSALRDSVGASKATAEAKPGVERVRQEAKTYAESKGLKYGEVGNQPLDTERSKKIASAYEQAKHEPDNPAVKSSYDAFKQETLDQYRFLKAQGVKFEPHTGEGQPYKNSAEMLKDVEQNKHLSIFTGGEMPADHPLAGKSGEKIGDYELTHNDIFRAVHDYFGHAREGAQFGPRGEDNAFRAHSAMYSEAARPAMATETRGQNSFVNFGPNGEHNRANPAETKYAEQKATILPEEFYKSEGRQSPGNYLSIGHRFRNDGSEELWWRDDEGKFQQAEVTAAKGTHIQHDAGDAQFRGRIDHTLKEISVVPSGRMQATGDTRQLEHVAKQMQKKYPAYDVYVSTKNGMTPIEEVAGGRMYPTLDKVKAIKESEPVMEKAKDIYNAATPENGWKYAKAVGDTLRKGLSDSLADFIDPIRAIDKNKPVSELPLEAMVRLHGGLADRIGKMRQYGLRKLFGDTYVDPKTEKAMNRDWQLDPVKQAVERLGDKATRAERRKEAYDFTTFSTRLGAAESTIERGNNSVGRETVNAMRDKVKNILSSLPDGERLVERVMKNNAPLPEGEATTPEKSMRQEIKAVREMVKSAKQSLSDMLAMNRKGPSDKVRPESDGSPDLNEQLSKARKNLEILNEFMNKTASEGHSTAESLKLHDLKDVFTAKEVEGILKKAEKKDKDGGDAFVEAADRKINQLLDSLPPDTLPKYAKSEPAEDTRTDEEKQADSQNEELGRINKAKRDIRKRLADAIQMVKAAERGPENGKPVAKEPAPIEDRITKAQQKLDKLDAIMDSVQTGKRIEPNEFFNADELAGLKKKALEKPLTGIAGEGANGFKDIEAAKAFIEQAKQEKNYDLGSEFLRRYRLMGTAHLDVLVQSGRISKDTASRIRKSNEFYTDMHRVMEKTGAVDPGQTAGSGVLHKFRGSNREIDNPYINQQMTTERSYQTAERNYILSEFIKQAKEHLPEKPELLEKEKAKEGPDTVTVYENGEKKIYKVDPVVAEAINGWGKHATAPAMKALSTVLSSPGRFMMGLMAKNPFYQINNIVKDMRSRAIISKESGGLKTLSTELTGFKDKDTRELVEVLGGTFGGRSEYAKTRQAYERITRKALNDIAGDSNAILAMPHKAWKGYQKLMDIGEAAGRTAEYTAQYEVAKKRGMADQQARTYAAWKARDLMDFAVSGTWVKAINDIAYVPFLNSGFRGLAKHLEVAAKDPVTYTKRMALFGFLPAMIPAVFAYSQGPEQWKKYKGIPLVQRIMFDNFMIGNTRVVIPRGEMVAAASAAAELGFENHLSPSDFLRAASASILPNHVDDPQSLLPLHGVLEASNNYSWFYNRNIIPPDEEGVALDLRKTDSASPLAKGISYMLKQAGMELDPRKIEHVINTDLGSAGSAVNTASRMGESKGMSTATKASMMGGYLRSTPGFTDEDVQQALSTAQRYKDESSPAVKAIKGALAQASQAKDADTRQKFVDQARDAAASANKFYDQHADTLQTVKKLGMEIEAATQEYNNQKTGQDKVQFLRDNPDKAALVRQQNSYDRITSRLNELRKVQVSPTVSDATKKMASREIDRLYGLLTKMAGQQ